MTLWRNGNALGASVKRAFDEAVQVGRISAYGHASALATEGLYESGPTAQAPTTRAVIDSGGAALERDSDGTINDDIWHYPSLAIHDIDANPIIRARFMLPTVTDIRWVLGMVTNIAPMVQNEDPSSGRQYATIKIDTGVDAQLHLQCSGSSASQSVPTTGVTIVASTWYEAILDLRSTGEYSVTVTDTAGAVLGAARSTANLPASGTGLFVMQGFRALAAAVKQDRIGFIEGANRGAKIT